MTVTPDFNKVYGETADIVNRKIDEIYDKKPKKTPESLWEAMLYSLRAGGKRLRPVMCLKSAEIMGMDQYKALPLALGLEMIHTASLIHDDLPCMDNDILRRGKPTNHVIYGESLSLLAGTSLFLMGMEYPLTELKRSDLDGEKIFQSIMILLKASGASGIHGGQVLDMQLDEGAKGSDHVWETARLKTAALIEAAVTSGATLAGADQDQIKTVSEYGRHVGIAFQIIDDILDVQGNTSELGKTTGKDHEQNKQTFVSIYGMEKAKRIASRESEKAYYLAKSLSGNNGNFFSQLVDYLESRTR